MVGVEVQDRNTLVGQALRQRRKATAARPETGDLDDRERARADPFSADVGAWLGQADQLVLDDQADDELNELRSLGMDPVEISPEQLDEVEALWVMGGDVMALREAFVMSGADDVVRRRLTEDSLVYAGYSAGACLLGPAFPDHSGRPAAGLDVVPFTVVPHHRSGQEPNPLVQWFVEQEIDHVPLRDGQVIVVDGPVTRVV